MHASMYPRWAGGFVSHGVWHGMRSIGATLPYGVHAGRGHHHRSSTSCMLVRQVPSHAHRTGAGAVLLQCPATSTHARCVLSMQLARSSRRRAQPALHRPHWHADAACPAGPRAAACARACACWRGRVREPTHGSVTRPCRSL